MTATKTAAKKRTRKAPPSPSTFRGTQIPVSPNTARRIMAAREAFDHVNEVDATRYAIALAVDVVGRVNRHRTTARVLAEKAVGEYAESKADAKQKPKPRYMRMRDRDFTRIDELRAFIAAQTKRGLSDVSQGDAVWFAARIEELYRETTDALLGLPAERAK